MKRAGRISPIVIVIGICILLVIPIIFVSSKGPANYAVDFMTALGKGDVNTLADLSIIGNDDLEQRKKDWEKTISYGKNYYYTWRVTNAVENTPDSAAVELQMRQNLQINMGKDENKFELPMRKVDGKWKVDVGSMDRSIYPALPRP